MKTRNDMNTDNDQLNRREFLTRAARATAAMGVSAGLGCAAAPLLARAGEPTERVTRHEFGIHRRALRVKDIQILVEADLCIVFPAFPDNILEGFLVSDRRIDEGFRQPYDVRLVNQRRFSSGILSSGNKGQRPVL